MVAIAGLYLEIAVEVSPRLSGLVQLKVATVRSVIYLHVPETLTSLAAPEFACGLAMLPF